MVVSFIRMLAGLMEQTPDVSLAGQEVALGGCALVDTDWSVCRKLRVGEELAMRERDGRVLVCSGGCTAGALDGDEAVRARALLEKGAGVICRVSSVNAGERAVKVRLLVRM